MAKVLNAYIKKEQKRGKLLATVGEQVLTNERLDNEKQTDDRIVVHLRIEPDSLCWLDGPRPTRRRP